MSRIHGSRHYGPLALAGVLGLLAPTGCADDEDTGGDQLGEQQAALQRGHQVGQPGGQQGQNPAILSDAEIAGVLKAVTWAEIEYSQVAYMDAESEEVHSFAELMIDHHIEALWRQGQLFERYGIIPAESARSRAFTTDMEELFDQVNSARGADLDMQFMEAQVWFHLALLDLVDTQLLPVAQHEALRDELSQVRAATVEHLQQAHEIHCALMGQGPWQGPRVPDLIGPRLPIELGLEVLGQHRVGQGGWIGLDLDRQEQGGERRVRQPYYVTGPGIRGGSRFESGAGEDDGMDD